MADHEARWRRLQLAQVLAIEPLARAVGALTEPSGRRVELESGCRSQWWDAGAFALVRSRAELCLRVTRELAQAQRELVPGSDSEPEGGEARDQGFERALAAKRALSAGDPEACLWHMHRALLALLRTADPDATPPGIGERFADLPSLSDHGAALRLLDRVVDVKDRAAGDLGVAIPLAAALLPLVQRLVADPTIDEFRADRNQGP